MTDLKPCPFCGGEAKCTRYDRVFFIGCDSCNYKIPFSGWIQTEPNENLVSAAESVVKEYYHSEAWEEAVKKWNRRVNSEYKSDSI